MICPKKKDGSSEYLQKVAFLEDEIAVSGDLNNIVCKIAYKRIKKYYSSQHYYIFKTRGGLLFCVEKSKISPADREKTCRTFQNKNATVKNTVGVAAKYIWTLENKKYSEFTEIV